ncbi:MAG: pyroglutamyl-peptidase I [Planctomycetes bacterium]|nr:pyroglutamyl-peptidase I [Planctomycetota bacterium]
MATRRTQRAGTVLVTGFEPFGGEATNPSQELAQRLDGRVVAGHRVVGRVLPCRFGAAREALHAALADAAPQLVVALGQAGGRAEISLERVAINVDDARIPDNYGAQPIDLPIVADGPAAYFATLPIKAIVHALRADSIPAAVSQTAGTFVCNHVFYALLHALSRRDDVRAGFVHVPYSDEQAARHPGAPGLPLDLMERAVVRTIETALSVARGDRQETGGAVS